MTRARDTSVNGSGNGGGGANGGGVGNITLAILQPYLTTANVKEVGGNLYFSNSRTFANIQLAYLDDLFDVVTKANGNIIATAGQALVWSGNAWTPGSVSANSNAIIGSVLSYLTTSNVRELGNLYFTNARARTAFTAGDPTITIDWVTGTIRANVSAIANAGSTTDAVPEGFNNKYYTNARVREYLSQSNLQMFGDVKFNSGDAGLIQLGQTLVWSNTGTRLAWVPGYSTTAIADFANNAEIANVVRTIGNFTTNNLAEGNVNLYFTTGRVANVIANAIGNISIDALSDVWTPSNLKITGYVLTWDGQQWMPAAANASGGGGVGTGGTVAFANVAFLANRANTSLYANVAGSTLYANVAGIANSANTALYANTAGSTYFANTSLYANTAGSTLYANVAGVANSANTALYANVAGSTLYANVAGVANNANTAIYANVAGIANTANIAAQVLTLSNFTTSNLTEGINLYFTNARAVTALTPVLTTANVVEAGNIFYYNTTRLGNDITAALVGKDITPNNVDVKGDLIARGNVTQFLASNLWITARQVQIASGASKSGSEGAGIVIPGANATFVYGQTNDGFGLNKDLTILGNIIPAIGGKFSLGTQAKPFRDLFLGTQTLYVGNTQVGSGASGGLTVTDASGNPAPITLSNVSATQYITIDRVLGNVTPLTEINSYIGGNVAQFVSGTTGNLYFGIMKDGALNKFAGLRVTEIKDSTGNIRSDLYFYNDSENKNTSVARLGILGTGNVTVTGNTVSINGTDIISNLGDFIGNAYYGSRPIDTRYGGTGGANTTVGRNNLFGDLPGTGGIVTKLKTTNALSSFAIVESTGVSVSGGDGQSGNIVISIGQNVSTIASVTFKDLTLTGNLYVFGNAATVYSNTLVVSDPLIQVGYGNPSDNYDLGFMGHYNTGGTERHAGFFRDHSDQTFKIFDNLTSEPGLNDVDTANVSFRLANVAVNTVIGNLIGYVSTLNNHTTAALNEGANNLYYTNTRVLSAVRPLLTTANVIEFGNLYYTDVRVNTAVRPMLTTANVIETSANLYFTNARVLAVLSFLTTANITEVSSNLYYTDARVNTAVRPMLTTANVIETSANLYFTNARVLAALSEANIEGNLRITRSLIANSIIINGNEVFASGGGANLFVNRLVADVVTANSYVSTGTGTPTLTSATNINLSANGAVVIQSSPLRLKTYTLPTANALSSVAGDIVYMSNTNSIHAFDGTTWVQVGEKLINARITDTVYTTNVVATGTLQSNTFVLKGVDVTNTILNSGNNIVANSVTANIWNNLYTANVIESPNNLYYTNARVLSNVSAMSINVLADVDITGIQNNGILIWNGSQFAAGTVSASASSNTSLFAYLAAFANTSGVANVSYFSNVANSVLSLAGHTTTEIAEGANLYFTNARVIAALSNATVTGNLYITDTLSANVLVIRGINVTNNVTANNVSASSFSGNSIVVDNITANIQITTSNLIVTGTLTARANTKLTLGNTVVGLLVSNAVTLTTETTVTDSITQLNQVLGKLVPSRPPAISSASSIGIQTLSSYRMTTVTQTDRTPSSRTVAAGNTVAVVRRVATYFTNTIANVGLADGGTVSVIKNGSSAGSRAMTSGIDNGIYGDLAISNDVDYSTVTGQASGFWTCFTANASGSVSGGWNEVYITHTTGGTSPTAYWYYDATTVAAPQITNTRIGPTSNVYSNSSTVPHFTSATNFMLQFDVNRLSGDMFPLSNTFITGSSGGALSTPTSVTYASANVSFPLAPNLYVASGNISTTTNTTVIAGFGVSAVGCSLTADNSYNTGAGTFTPTGNILYKTGTGSVMEESTITFSSAIGTGSGLAARIENPGSADTPAYTANALLFNSQTSTLQTYDATIVGAVLKHDQVNYSTGYLPVGPNLSTGRSAPQYFTFRFVRTSVSKFDIQFSGTIAGMWVALPGSAIDNTSTLNGWLDMSASATTSGIPGANTGAGGNGNNGCAIGGPVTLNTLVSSHRKTCTFGTVSSSSTATNEIYVRIKLTAGQTVSALTLQTASN